MDGAKLVEYDLDITLGCPKCDYLFQLSNYSIPTEGSTYQVCENCNIALEVKPISIEINFKKPVKIKKKKEVPIPKNRLLEDAKSIIQTYGFSMKEINHVLNTLDTDGMAVETIVKEVLSRIDNKHESTKT
jgi:ribosomal protein S4E